MVKKVPKTGEMLKMANFVFENVLKTGEMLKMLKLVFENVLKTGEMLKMLKMLKLQGKVGGAQSLTFPPVLSTLGRKSA